MIARVTLELSLRKEFDYLIPAEFENRVEEGLRVKVPFGPRCGMGCVTVLVEESTHTNLRAILGVVGTQSLVTPEVLEFARWIGKYYCCSPEVALKSVLPEVVRREQEGWRERFFVRMVPPSGALPQPSKRQLAVWNILVESKEKPLEQLLEMANTTPATVRRLEVKGLWI